MIQLPSLEGQDRLADPIKVSLGFNTDARHSLNRQVEIAGKDEDTMDYAAAPAVSDQRQKTNVVLKSREEIQSLFRLIRLANPRSRNSGKALRRLQREVKEEAKRRGIRIDNSDRYRPKAERVEAWGGDPPPSPPVQPGDIVKVPGTFLGYKKGDGSPAYDPMDAKVDTLGSEMILVRRYPFTTTLKWVPFYAVVGFAEDAMKRREITKSVKAKRRQADRDALLDLIKRHLIAESNRVWPEDLIPVEDFEIRWNDRLSYYGGYYYGRKVYKKGGSTPVIEIAWKRYVNHGLARALEIARHELIHAWQDFHPDGHPPDTHRHHGRDFKQWVDDLNTR